MKKRLIALMLTLLPLAAGAQDTAVAIVERYLQMINSDGLRPDSTLVVETEITFHGSTDTLRMRRMEARGGMHRVEMWRGDSLTMGFCTNGTTRFRKYAAHMGWWNDVDSLEMVRLLEPYDLWGPLHGWREKGIALEYRGTSSFKGQTLLVVRARQQDRYTRQYLFEQSSGLLLIILEEDDLPVTDERLKALRISPLQYKIYHEYQPVGESLVTSQESYMRDDLLTIMESKARYEAFNPLVFNQD